MSELKPLFIPLKAEYFDAFESGTKTTEYRRYGHRWNERTCPVGRPAILSRGYGRKHRLSGRVKSFRLWPVFELPWETRAAIRKCYDPAPAHVAAIEIEVERATPTGGPRA